ncbi:required for excision 1-B domain-containing protein-like isoform X1 [Exaiptasia diaphana]|uniref:Uncharacterized protein n=1 Tax=Exaiptasia diaphana TaxID=2652724 RepID=A0A913WSJ8_EXADI|nr:required for excision 1-B domain-containing protein-like isoform X1 [Exaiptasia diaphana]
MEEPEESTVNLKELIKKFFSLQENRVNTYKTFDEGFKQYLVGNANCDFLKYRQHVHKITQIFINLSQEIRTIEAILKQNNKHHLAGIIRSIQLKEKEKLDLLSGAKLSGPSSGLQWFEGQETTAKLQIKAKDCIEHPEEDYSDDIASLKTSLHRVIEDINDFLQDLKYESEDILLEEYTKEI